VDHLQARQVHEALGVLDLVAVEEQVREGQAADVVVPGHRSGES
jgi:hypothetical protein